MRRYSFPLIALTLTMLLTAGLTRAEETKSCQKSMTGTAVGCEQRCAAEKAAVKTEGMTAIDAGHHGGGEGCPSGHGMKDGSGSAGCHGSGVHGAKGCRDAGGVGCGGSGGCHGSGAHGMKGCGGTGGCHKMMSGGKKHGMMGMHQGMMDRGGWSGRHMSRGMDMDLPRLGGPEHLVRMAQHLELTDKQIEDLKALRRDHEKGAIEMRAEIALARVDMKELLDQEPLNFGKIKDMVSQIADMHKKLRLSRWTLMERSHDLLTDEQLEEAKALRKQGPGMIKEGRREMIKKMIIEETEE